NDDFEDQTFVILATGVESAAKILEETAKDHPEIFEHSPSLKSVKDLKVNWMVGLLFYLHRDIEMTPGHIAYLNSPWAITSISPNQFWRRKMLSIAEDECLFEGEEEFDRKITGVLSVILSNWDSPGIRDGLRSARDCKDVRDIAHEAMWQIRA